MSKTELETIQEVQESEQSAIEQKPKVTLFLGEKATWLKRDIIPHSFPLIYEDKVELAEKMAKAQGEIDALEDQLAEIRKSMKAEIDVLQSSLKNSARIFRSGMSDPVQVKCDIFQDWATEELVWVTADERMEEIQRRKMTAEEKQLGHFKDASDKSMQ